MDTLNAKFYVPEKYNGRRIKFRSPYTMPGELVLAAGALNTPFPEATFLQTVDKPFEIWDVVLRAAQSVGDTPFLPVADPAPSIDQFWRIRMQDLSKNQNITKNAQLVATLVDNDDDIWRWPIPYTIIRAEGFDISVDNLLPVNFLRAEITFRGYLLVLEPPSETR